VYNETWCGMPMQVIINSLIAGSEYALIAIGFSLVFRIAQFFFIAYGAVYTAGGYIAYVGVAVLGVSPWVAIPTAVLLAGALGTTIDVVVHRRLRRRRASPSTHLIASLGVLVVLQNSISLIFGDATIGFRAGVVREGWFVFGARITPVQVVTVAAGLLVPVIIWLCLHRSRWGRMVRAVASDSELASVHGIPCGRIISGVFLLSSSLAACSAILAAYDTDLTPAMGFSAVLMAIIAVIVGGSDSHAGAIVGAYFVGAVEHVVGWSFSTQWQEPLLFCTLIAFLLLRPNGILGRRPARGGT